MNLLSKILSVSAISFGLMSCQTTSYQATKLSNEWQPLLTHDLSGWEVWMGVPHSSVKDLPEGTFQLDRVSQHGDPKDAMGLNNDVKNVFTMIEQDGEPVLHISGEIYGGISTKAHYKNYHLSLQVKWGDKKWAPRINALRDSGLLFHCKGEHGGFWRVWKICQEFQVQETDFGDYIPLGNKTNKTYGKIRSRKSDKPHRPTYDPKGKLGPVGYASAFPEVDKPHGEWNTVELYAFSDRAVFVVNKTVVMVVQDSKDNLDQILDSGQLQLQSEGAELFYKDIKIKSLDSMPTTYLQYF